jgi:2'-5' RNA ligase
VVLVAEAETLVAAHRLVHDPMAARGVPAHVTVLHPFRSSVDEEAVATIAATASGIPSFDATFSTVGRFPDGVVFLAPEPLDNLRKMTRAFAKAFPDCPPYGGAFPDPQPHLTVGVGLDDAEADVLERAMAPGLPLSTRVDLLTLLVEDDEGRWTVDQSWPLAAARMERLS